MRKLLSKNIIAELLIIFILSLTPLLWFKPGTILVGHDNTYPLAPKIFLANRLTTWTENFFGHDQSLILGTIPIHFIDATPSFFGIPLQAGQAIVYVFWFFSIGLSAYILAWVLRPESRLFRVTAVILYQFNYFILQGWWIGEKSKFSAYIALPLVLALVFLVTQKKLRIVTGAILASLILFVFNAGGLYGVPLYGGALVAIGVLVILKVLAYLHEKNYEALRRLVLFILATIVLTVLANSYFLIPAYAKLHVGAAPGVTSVGGVSGIISWAAEISANASFLNLFRLQGIPEWYDNPEHLYAKYVLGNPLFIAASFLWPLLVLASLLVAKKTRNDRMVTYFFIVYLVGIFFTAGTHPPLGFLYQFFVEHVPGFVIFRTPYFKFAPAVFLATAFLIAYFISSFSNRTRTLMFVLFSAIVFGYHYPYFTGNFFGWRNIFSTRLTIPSYVYEFGTWLNREKSDDGRVLFLPPNSQDLRYSVYNWGYLSFQALPTLLSGKSVVINNDQVNPTEQAMLKNLYQAIERRDEAITKTLASILHISYFVLQKDVISDPKSTVPIDGKAYAQAVRDNNQFVFVRSFGEWDVFKLREMIPQKFYTTNRVMSLHGDIQKLDPYYSFIGDTTTFIENSDAVGLSAKASDFIVPTCLTCPYANRPVISFPERNVLPDDPFYQIVLLLENRRPIPEAPKAAIYHLLGISLKRISEINEMLYRQKVLTKDMVDRYTLLLQSIEQNFQQLPSLQEKIVIARDVRDYLRAERNFLRPNLNKNVPAGAQTVLAGRIFGEISRLEKKFQLPELTLDETHSRVYQFTLTSDDELELLLRTAEFRQIVDEGDQLSVVIDNNFQRDLHITKTMLERSWLSFGRLRIPAGFHTLALSFPESRKKIQALSLAETEFSVPNDNTCFGARVGNLDSSKLYKLNVSYLNDFSDNLLLYIWDQEVSTRKLKNAVKFLTSGLTEKSEQIIGVSEGTKEVLIALCAPNLTQELINKQFQVRMSEILFPVLFLYSQDVAKTIAAPVSFQQITPTRYRISVPNGNAKQKVLVFSERYDDWWELRGAPGAHVRANGYANAWILEQNTPLKELTIRYKGEEYFFWGKLVSLFTVAGSIGYISYLLIRRRKHNG